MKRHWDEHELAERWSLTHDEFELLRNRTERWGATLRTGRPDVGNQPSYLDNDDGTVSDLVEGLWKS